MYRTDGSSHHSGVKAEQVVSDELNNQYQKGNNILDLSDFDGIKFQHLGTTQYNADVIGIKNNKVIATISLKKKKYKDGRISGTFDMINTTFNNVSWISDVVDVQPLVDFREKVKSQKGHITKSEMENKNHPLRKEYQNVVNNAFKIKDGDDATEVLKFIEPLFLKSQYLMIIYYDNDNNKIEKMFVSPTTDKSGNPIFTFTNGNKKFGFFKGGGKSSRTIREIVNNIPEKKYFFRLRVILNNGLTPLLGLSTKNNDSSWVIHIQVDGVKNLIDKMKEAQLK